MATLWQRFFLIIFVLLGLQQVQAQVWAHSSTQFWNEKTETRFSKWVENDVQTHLLSHPGMFYSGLKIDCADLHYLLRIIFSYENGLEFAINDPHSAREVISSLSPGWNKYKNPNERLRQFTRYVLDVTSTQTLPNDTVLIGMDSKSIRPGVVLLGDLRRGHSMIIKKINPSGVPVLYYASLPASEFIYIGYHFPEARGYFPMGPITVARGGGLRRFRWLQDLKKETKTISYSSESQIFASENLDEYFEHVQTLVRVKPRTADDTLNYLMDDLCSQMRVRVNAITDAVRFVSRTNARRMSASEDDRFSTYKRDENIVQLIKQLERQRERLDANLTTVAKKRYQRVFEPEGTTADECLVDWAVNRIEPLGWLVVRFKNQQISSRANDTLARRWGL